MAKRKRIREYYNSHMGIIKPKSIGDEIPDTQFTSPSLTNYEVSRGLKILEEEYNIERQRGKKNIKSRARPQRMHFDGTPSAFGNYLKNSKWYRIYLTGPEVLERLRKSLDIAGILEPFSLCVGYIIVDSLLSTTVNLSGYYISMAGVPNKPSKEEFEKVLTPFIYRLKKAKTKKELKCLVEFFGRVMRSPFAFRGLVLLAVGESYKSD